MKLFKNPVFQGLVLVLGGMIVAGWGWDKHDSTDPARTGGSVFMMVVGSTAIVAGLIIWYLASNRKGGTK